VVNQFYGGFLLKTVPSSHFEVVKLPIDGGVHCRHFGKISTKSIISDKKKMDKINRCSEDSISRIKGIMKSGKINFDDISGISYDFALKSGLLSDRKTKSVIGGIRERGGNASMIMLGKSVFSDVKFNGSSKYKISDKRACLL
jgi:pantoate kinase